MSVVVQNSPTLVQIVDEQIRVFGLGIPGPAGPQGPAGPNGPIGILDNVADATAPTAGHYLRGNGTEFENSAIQAADLPSHTHSAADITSGTLAAARLGSGTSDNSRFLRGDGTWSDTLNGLIYVTGLSFQAGGSVTGHPLGTGQTNICGGGGANNVLGGVLSAFGSSHVTFPGCIQLYPGTNAGANITIYDRTNANRLRVNETEVSVTGVPVNLGNAATIGSSTNGLAGTSAGPRINANTGLSVAMTVGATVNSNFGAAFGSVGSNKWAVGQYGTVSTVAAQTGIGSDGGSIWHNVPTGQAHYFMASNVACLTVNENGIGGASAASPLNCFHTLRSVGCWQQGANGIAAPPIERPRAGANTWSVDSLASPNPVQTTTIGNDTPGGWWSVFTDTTGTNTGNNWYQISDLIPIDPTRCYEGEIYAKLLAGTTGAISAGMTCYNSSGTYVGQPYPITAGSKPVVAGGTTWTGTISGEGTGVAGYRFPAATRYCKLAILVAGTGAWSIAVGPYRLREIEHQACLRNSAAQAIASHASTNYVLSWNTQESLTSDATHLTGTNPSRWTCPRSGRYRVTAFVEFDSMNTGVFRGEIWRNGSVATGCSRRQPNLGAYNPGLVGQMDINRTLVLTAGDYLELAVGQDSGSSSNATTNCYLQVKAEH